MKQKYAWIGRSYKNCRGSGCFYAIVFSFGILVSCIEPAERRYEQRLHESVPPIRHAIHNQRLIELMRELARLFVERLPKGMNIQTVQKNHARAVAEVSRAMAVSAAKIPMILYQLELNENQQKTFLQLAQSLHRESMALSKQATNLSLVEMNAALVRIQETCVACHHQFRPLSQIRNPGS